MGRASDGKHRFSRTAAIVEIRRLFDQGAQDTKTLIAAMDKKGYPREVIQGALADLESLNILSAVPETRKQAQILHQAADKAERAFVKRIMSGR